MKIHENDLAMLAAIRQHFPNWKGKSIENLKTIYANDKPKMNGCPIARWRRWLDESGVDECHFKDLTSARVSDIRSVQKKADQRFSQTDQISLFHPEAFEATHG